MILLLLDWILPSVFLFVLLLLLGVQNLLMVDLISQRVKSTKGRGALRWIGLSLGLMLQISFVVWYLGFEHSFPILFEWGLWRPNFEDLFLVFGGAFLSYQMWNELIWPSNRFYLKSNSQRLYRALLTILVVQIFFALESTITIVALQTQLYLLLGLMIFAALMVVIMYQKIYHFFFHTTDFKVILHAFMAVLGLAFFLKGLHFINSIWWIYPMLVFSLLVELLNIRKRHIDRIQDELRELE